MGDTGSLNTFLPWCGPLDGLFKGLFEDEPRDEGHDQPHSHKAPPVVLGGHAQGNYPHAYQGTQLKEKH